MFERYPADWWPLEVTGLYYEQLLADLDFRAALAVLFQDLAEPAERLETLGDAIWTHPDFRSFQPSIVPEWAQYWNAYQDYYRAYNDVGQELSAFSARWHLPTEYGPQDVWYSLNLHLASPESEPTLLMSARVCWQPVVGTPVAIDEVQSGSERIVISMKLPYIFPNVPLPFLYDPVEQNRAWLNERIDAICANVRQSILSQAEVLESQVEAEDWKKRSTRYTPSYLRRIARALYLRAVKCMKWDDIGRKCGVSSPNDFAKRVRYFAAQCSIPLPKS